MPPDNSKLIENLTVLITGPYDHEWYMDKLSPQIEKLNIPTVIATWKKGATGARPQGKNITYLELHDPGSEFGYIEGGANKPLNILRQHTLLDLGIKHVETTFCLRIRSDITIDIQLLENFSNKIIDGLIISTDISSISPRRPLGEKLDFHICDWLFAAKTEVIEKIILSKVDESKLLNVDPIKIKERRVYSKITAEQSFSIALLGIDLNKLCTPELIQMPSPTSPVDFGFWICRPQDLNLKSKKYGLRAQRLRRIYPNENYRFKIIPFSTLFILDTLKALVKYLKGKTN